MQSLTGLMADHLAPAKRAALRARPRIAILIPCLDEELTIGGVIEQFRKELPQAKIYVFDNNSTDHTVERAREKGAVLLRERRQGKGCVVQRDRKSTRLNSSHVAISYAVFCLKKKKTKEET